MTPSQQAQCQADVDRMVKEFDAVGVSARVRVHGGWIEEETGEEFPAEWVAEVRLGRGKSRRIVTLDVAGWSTDAPAWIEVLRDGVAHAARRAAR